MSRQTVFNRALSHLRTQGKKSVGHIGCAYRGDDGMKCAIGIFIPDSKYDYSMEDNTVDCTCVFDALPKTVSRTGERFLSNIQGRLHDDIADYCFKESLEKAAIELAASYGLKYSAPETTS